MVAVAMEMKLDTASSLPEQRPMKIDMKCQRFPGYLLK